MNDIVPLDPWRALRRHTAARIALGRSGGSVPTRALLAFTHDHALARDAVHAPFAVDELIADLNPLQQEVITLASGASDRATYLRRPDFGRRLAPESNERLRARTTAPCDLAIVISDGLSSLAAARQVPPLLAALLPKLADAHWRLAPLCVIPFARVGIIDEVGAALQASLALILLGERPGLGAADSLGAYFEFSPAPGRTDAERNCVSNIRPAGLPPAEAATKLMALLTASRRLALSGVRLKEEAPRLPNLARSRLDPG